ncbi:MAG: hypothetical protein JW731_13600 [Bacteroidales bacterium]|nr:hypothetical protein [Bacteroidales bacterium]
MQFKFYRFLKKLIIYTVLLAIIGFIIARLIPGEFITPTLPYLYLFFLSVTIIVHYILLKVSEKRTNSFINYFMLLTFGKLIFFLSIIITYSLIYRSDAIPFIITFFILYVFYTVFEVVLSLSHTTGNSR